MAIVRFHFIVLLMLLSFRSEAQILKGTVLDSQSSEPLQGAGITLDPPGPSAVTGPRGTFSIPVRAEGGQRLTVSYMGYASQTIAITQADIRSGITIRLVQVPMPGPVVEVMAQRATERYSPVTFTDLPRARLEEKYIVQDIPVMLADLPSSTFYSESGNGIGYTYLRIRGFDQRRLAITVNGVPQNEPEDHNVYWLDFADILGSTSEIQVQRGGGSAFYGPPAIGGSVNIVTGDFADRKGIQVSSGIGSYGTRRTSISAGSGLLDNTYVMYARLSKLSSDGYRDHSWSDFNTYYLSLTRYDSTLTTRVIVYGGPLEDGLAYYGLPKFAIGDKSLRRKNYNYWEAAGDSLTYIQARRNQEKESFSQPHYELHNEWMVSPELTLHSTLFHVRGTGYFDYDGTGYTNAEYFRLTPEYGFNDTQDPIDPIIRAYVDNSQWGWLPRATWQHAGGRLITGLELRSHRSLHWGRIQWAEGLPASLDPGRNYYQYRGGKDIISGYVQEMYQLGSSITLMGNLQYVHNTYRLYDEEYLGHDFKVNYNFVNPGFGMNLNVSPELNIYATATYTQREPQLKHLYDAAESSGGSMPQFEQRIDGSFDYSNPFVKPEQLLNFELGTGFVRNGLRLYVNGFYMDFTNEIVKSGQIDRFGQPITGNAPRSLHIGLEGSLQYAIFDCLLLDANATVSRDRLKEYSIWETVNDVAVKKTLDNNRIAGFPELLLNIGVTWRWEGLWASAQWKYVGDQYTDNFQLSEHRVDPYAVLNLTLGCRIPNLYGFRSIGARLLVNNALDRLYAQSGEGEQFFPAAERNYMMDITVEF
jgi:iron complex outermembrane receptor protein